MHQAHHTSQVGQSFEVRHTSLSKELASNQLFLILLISLLILSCCFVALCRFVLLYADGALRQGTHFISLSFKVFFVIYLYITLFYSLCCPPSVSSLLCPARSPPVSSSLYTALYSFTQILMIPPFFSFVFACESITHRAWHKAFSKNLQHKVV